MTPATHAQQDARLLRVHRRWCELTATYEREHGEVTPAVFGALFDRAVREVGR